MTARDRRLTSLHGHLIRWDAGLSRSFTVGEHTVYVRPAAIQDPGKPLRVDVSWQPARPERLTFEQIAAFDAGKRCAIAELLEALS